MSLCWRFSAITIFHTPRGGQEESSKTIPLFFSTAKTSSCWWGKQMELRQFSLALSRRFTRLTEEFGEFEFILFTSQVFSSVPHFSILFFLSHHTATTTTAPIFTLPWRPRKDSSSSTTDRDWSVYRAARVTSDGSRVWVWQACQKLGTSIGMRPSSRWWWDKLEILLHVKLLTAKQVLLNFWTNFNLNSI